MTGVGPTVRALHEEARRVDERRLLVLHGDREATERALTAGLAGVGLPGDELVVLSGTDLPVGGERLSPSQAGDLLGTTWSGVVVDCRDACPPNALGRATGAVDGGGLLVLLAPPLDEWPDRRDGFDEGLAVPPFGVEDVTGRFRRRLVATLRAHPGVALVGVEDGPGDGTGATVERDGLTDPAPRRPPPPPSVPEDREFPAATYEACLTADQVEAVRACEALRLDGTAVVVEADRGRGKSSAVGLAAGALAAAGRDVLVTAPGYRNAREVFVRAGELLDDLGVDHVRDDGDRRIDTTGASGIGGTGATGGTVRFAPPVTAADLPGDPDAVVVDEAAAVPVRLLSRFVASGAPPVAFATTVHGYEGAGRGFSVRFRAHLDESDRDVTTVSMAEPIRYAAGDPVEVWLFRALLLDASPAVEPLVADATPATTEYVRPDRDALADLGGDGERRLREAFGLLVTAHYRTEPDDLARLLDAPNLSVRALVHEGHVVSVALLAREGGLSAERRARIYEGERVRGNMLPDVLTSQLRDEAAGEPVGWRVVRIATHHAVRSRGLGSELLDEIEREAGERSDPRIDYLGVGYGATPDLLRFWRENGYRTVHLSTGRNDASGEYSALMLRSLSDAGEALHDRSAAWFVRRVASVLADALDDADPDVIRGTLRATDAAVPLDLTDREWRLVASAAFGPGQFDMAPRPFRRLALCHLVERRADLSPDAERLLVRRALQARPWEWAVDDLGYVSRRECMKALGRAYRPLVETYGPPVALAEADRYR